MMKKVIMAAFVACFCLMSGCFTYTTTVGKGAQTGIENVGKNHYLIYGLVDLKTTPVAELAGDATNYDVTITHTFVDGLVNFLTGGIYSPTTVKVRK